jgi:hypothetical protein
VAELGERRLVTTAGVNVNRTRGVGQELFALPAEATVVAAAFDNDGLGANLGMTLPVWSAGDLSVDAALAYNFNRVMVGLQVPGLPPELVTHVGLFTLRGLFGRGTAQGAVGAGGRTDADELDAFSADPRSGAPLITARLLRQGAPMIDPTPRPGAEATGRADSAQAYRQSLRQQGIEREARARAGAIESVGSYQDEERRALEREKAELQRRREERTRDFGEWPGEPAKPAPVEDDRDDEDEDEDAKRPEPGR